jgi:holo-[acyl-carrier protein] synthase
VILGLGTDLVEVARIGKSVSAYGDKFTHRVFTAGERTYSESKANLAERYAARFAAKEAAMKALGTGWGGGVTWTQIEVVNAANGRPALVLHDAAEVIAARLGVKRTWLSLTHTSAMASAVVVFEG